MFWSLSEDVPANYEEKQHSLNHFSLYFVDPDRKFLLLVSMNFFLRHKIKTKLFLRRHESSLVPRRLSRKLLRGKRKISSSSKKRKYILFVSECIWTTLSSEAEKRVTRLFASSEFLLILCFFARRCCLPSCLKLLSPRPFFSFILLSYVSVEFNETFSKPRQGNDAELTEEIS